MKRRIAALAGVGAVMAASLVVGGASPAQAETRGCTHFYVSDGALGECSAQYVHEFKVGVKCLAPGNVWYWRWTSWIQAPNGGFIPCYSGHVPKGSGLQGR